MAEDYQVQQGDCISSIAFDHGFFWQTLWNDGSNADLKSKRKNPNVLLLGDVVHIPDLRPKQQSGATEQKHKFKLKGVPAKFQIRILDESSNASGGGAQQSGKPRANVPFRLYVDGVLYKEGQTDGSGYVKSSLPPSAAEGRLVLQPGTPDEAALLLNFGCIDPIDEISGVQTRLRNLGFDCGDETGELGPQTQEALKGFQSKNGLQPTGELTQSTRDKLRQVHDEGA